MIYYNEKGKILTEKEWTAGGYDIFGKVLCKDFMQNTEGLVYLVLLRFYGREDLAWVYEELCCTIGKTVDYGSNKQYGVFHPETAHIEAGNMADTFKLNSEKLAKFLKSGTPPIVQQVDGKPDDFLDKMANPMKLKKNKFIKNSEVYCEVWNVKCPLCDGHMILKDGAYGKFYSCSNWKYGGCQATFNADGKMSKKTKTLVDQKKKENKGFNSFGGVDISPVIKIGGDKGTSVDTVTLEPVKKMEAVWLDDQVDYYLGKIPQEGQPIKIKSIDITKAEDATGLGLADISNKLISSADDIVSVQQMTVTKPKKEKKAKAPELDELDERLQGIMKNKEGNNG